MVIEVLVNWLSRVPKLPGKPGILSFTFPGLENAWHLLKNWKTWNFNSKPGKSLYFVYFVFQDSLLKMTFSKKIWFMSLSYLHYQHKHWFKAKLTWDFIAFLPGNNLENTWNFVSPQKWEPCCLNNWLVFRIRARHRYILPTLSCLIILGENVKEKYPKNNFMSILTWI